MASRSKQAARARPEGSLRLLCAGGWGTGAEGGTKKPSWEAGLCMGSPSGSGLTYVNSGRRPKGTGAQTVRVENRGRRTGGTGRRSGGREGRAKGDERPEGTKGRRGRRRRAEGGNMKKPNLPGWALYGTPEAGDDACQFWPEAGDMRCWLRSPKRGQRRRGWQRLTP